MGVTTCRKPDPPAGAGYSAATTRSTGMAPSEATVARKRT